jgi:hypothetical protein
MIGSGGKDRVTKIKIFVSHLNGGLFNKLKREKLERYGSTKK